MSVDRSDPQKKVKDSSALLRVEAVNGLDPEGIRERTLLIIWFLYTPREEFLWNPPLVNIQ